LVEKFMSWRSSVLAAGIALAAPVLILRAQETRQVTAGKEYETSSQHRRWFGEGYRDVWATPFVAPVLDLSKERGGLEPVRQVGGLQTPGLAMRGADGRSYTFRSLEKEPERLLPPEWRESWPAKVIRDATSATHPGAAVILPVLAEAAGIPHTQPRLMVMPDDPKLGTFRQTFANKLGTFEEYPTAGSGTTPGFENATEIISSAELWERWLKGPENRIDSRALVRARILDLFVDNYDRRRGQWRWMKIPGRLSWAPLPEDPDMAFLRHDGFINRAMRQHRPQLLVFSDEYPKSMEGPTLLAAEVDRWLLSDVDIAVYREIARDLQSAWTDEVLEKAAAQLPAEWRAVDNGFLVASLKARRADLVDYVERFYHALAKRVEIHLTDQTERVTIMTAKNGEATISASVAGAAAPYFTRTFSPDDTKELRIYVHGGEDHIERSGPDGSIHVRIIADEGSKTIESPNQKTEVWANSDHLSGSKVSRHDPWINPAPVKDAPWIEPRDYGATTIVLPTAWYTTDIGLALGASLTRTTFGFRSIPAAKKQTIRAGWAFGPMAGKIDYHGIFGRPASDVRFDLRALGSSLEQINYFGLGNETPEQSKSAYRSRQRVFAVAPSVRLGSSLRFQTTVGPELRYSRSNMDDPTVLALEAPYGSGSFGSLRFKGTIDADTRHLDSPSVLELVSGSPDSEPADQPPGLGFRVHASASVAPPILDVQSTYGGLEGLAVAYVGSPDVQLALRLGGARLFGTFPYFDAAAIGGGTDRGFVSHRFAGRGSLYGTTELRAFLTRSKYESVFPVRFGLLGFVDTGRVWQTGEDSSKWHTSYGGGVLVKAVGTPIVFRAVVAFSAEDTLFYVGSGLKF
jgi:hypothetical protein